MITTEVISTGFSINFPDPFDVAQYFRDEQIDVNHLINRSGLIPKLKSRKIANTNGAKAVLDCLSLNQ